MKKILKELLLLAVTLLVLFGCSKIKINNDNELQLVMNITDRTGNEESEYKDYIFAYLEGNILHITDKEIIGKTIKCESVQYDKAPHIEGIFLSDYFGKLSIHKIIVDDKVKIDSASYMFFGLPELVEIENINNIITKDVSHMFENCDKLISFDVSKWNLENVTNMAYMYSGCKSLQYLDVSNWNVKNVIEMNYMFSECKNLKQLDVSKWNVGKVKYMTGMFDECENLIYLNMKGWNTENLRSTSEMFFGCIKLRNIDIDNWNIGNLKMINGMFYQCDESIIPNWFKTFYYEKNRNNNDKGKNLPSIDKEWENIFLK